MTDAFGKGLRKGDAQSTARLNIVMEKLMRNIKTNPNGTILERKRHYVAYADNVAMPGRSLRAFEEVLVSQIKKAAVGTGMVINESKTKYMKINET
jgi:hypothetical protein